jgi:hypothetical protein
MAVSLISSASLPDLASLGKEYDQDDADREDFYYEATPSPEISRRPSPTPSLGHSEATTPRTPGRSPSPPLRPHSALSDPGEGSRFYPASPTSDHSDETERRPFSRGGSVDPYPLGLQALPFSLVDYLKEEIRATELDGFQELKTERITNFLSVPFAVERVRARLT